VSELTNNRLQDCVTLEPNEINDSKVAREEGTSDKAEDRVCDDKFCVGLVDNPEETVVGLLLPMLEIEVEVMI
jgi:hypothetical protein